MPLTAEQIEKSRAELLESFPYLKGVPLTSSGGYHDRYDNALWKGWLARQETLCVELPPMHPLDNGFSGYDADDIHVAIEDAGIAHK